MKKNNNQQTNRIPRQIIKSGDFKYLDTYVADTVSTTSGAVVIPSLNIVPTGTTAQTRVGKRIKIFRIDYMIQVNRGYETNNTDTASNSRVALIKDNATKGATPPFSDIYETTSINSFINAQNSRRFEIIKEFKFVHNNYGGYNQATSQPYVLPSTKLKKGTLNCDIPILFSSTGTTGAVTQTVENCLLVTFVGDNTKSVIINAGTVFRIYFVDF